MARRLNKSGKPGLSHQGAIIDRGVFLSETEQELILFCSGEGFIPITPIPVGTLAYFDDGIIAMPVKGFQPVIYPFKTKIRIVVPSTLDSFGAGTFNLIQNQTLRFQVFSDIDNVYPALTRQPIDCSLNFSSSHTITYLTNFGYPYYMALRNPNMTNNLIQVYKSNNQFGINYNDYIKQDNINNAHSTYPRNGDTCHITIPENCGAHFAQLGGETTQVFINLRDFQERQDERKDLIFASTFLDVEQSMELAVIDVRKYHSIFAYLHTDVACGGTLSLREYCEIFPCNSYVIDSIALPVAGAGCVGVRGNTVARYVQVYVEITEFSVDEAVVTVVGSYA